MILDLCHGILVDQWTDQNTRFGALTDGQAFDPFDQLFRECVVNTILDIDPV
ncbi:hypothetical protein D3C71_2252530 [compost metagenome]